MFPIGGLKKSVVRRIAREAGIPVAEKKESRDACFTGGDYKEFLAGVCRAGGKDASTAGDIADESGRVLGRHDGIFRFTVGQRSGVGVAAKERLYVLNIDLSTRRVTVGPRSSALSKSFSVGDWLLHARGEKLPAEYGIKIRYLSAEIKGRVSRQGDNLEVELDTAAFGVTPGQSAVFYKGDKIVGGGIIKAVASD
jgi:tRNA-specific 2-thiouridylase